jgi:lipocalin-like protein
MKQLISLTVTVLLLSVLLSQSNAATQSAVDQLRGSSWKIVSGSIERDGNKVHWTPPRLQGFLMFDVANHFLVVIVRSGLPKSVPNPGQAGANGEKTPILQKSIACFGTYSINDADHTISVHIEGSTFPKWTGTDQQRRFTLAGDQLKWTNASPSAAAGTAELAWKRVK